MSINLRSRVDQPRRCVWLCVYMLVDTYSLSCLPLADRLAINLPRSRSCSADLLGGSRQHERDLRSCEENYEARSLPSTRERECTYVEMTGSLVNLRPITPLSGWTYETYTFIESLLPRVHLWDISRDIDSRFEQSSTINRILVPDN